jgi:hypothetical protein
MNGAGGESVRVGGAGNSGMNGRSAGAGSCAWIFPVFAFRCQTGYALALESSLFYLPFFVVGFPLLGLVPPGTAANGTIAGDPGGVHPGGRALQWGQGGRRITTAERAAMAAPFRSDWRAYVAIGVTEPLVELAAGRDLRYDLRRGVSERLGHSDPTITLRQDAHVLSDQRSEVVRVIGGAMLDGASADR